MSFCLTKESGTGLYLFLLRTSADKGMKMNMQNLSLFEIILIALIFSLYFLPFLIASLRQHKNIFVIFLLNLTLGWTFLGWIAALIWSIMNNKKDFY